MSALYWLVFFLVENLLLSKALGKVWDGTDLYHGMVHFGRCRC